jgi:hypothetical protein
MLARAIALLLLITLAGCDMAPEIDCDLLKITEMPLEVEDHLLVVPVGINGHWVRLIVDTGAERTTISQAAADHLGLPHDPRYVNRSVGIGGTTTTTDVTVDRLVLGTVHFPVSRIGVGTFRLQTARGLDADGLLGADILLAFDMDIDVAGGKLTLYRSRICPHPKPPWPVPAIEIAGVRDRKDRLLLPFKLDNVPGMAILDTGAQGNVLGVEMARRMGLTEQAMADDPPVRQRGTGPSETIARLHRFKLLLIGPVAVEAPVLTVLNTDFGIGDAIISEEFLEGRRLWLSFRNRQVFISRRQSEQ